MFNKLAARSQKISPGLRKIIGNSSWLLADRILRMGVGLFVGVWVARYLGPEQFGFYNYAIAFVALFSAVATLGLDGIVVRDLVRDPACKEETLGTAFILKLIGGIVTLLLTIGTVSLLRPDDNLTLWLVGITATGLIFQAFDTIDFWFQSQVQSKYTVYAKNTAFVLIALVKVILIQKEAPLIAFAWAGLAEFAIGAFGLVTAYQMTGHHLKAWGGSVLQAKKLLQNSWPLILSGMVIMVYMRIDQVMLAQMKDATAVGVYSAAVRLSEVWYFIPTAIVSSVLPSIVEAKKISEKLYYERIQKLFNLMSVLAYAIAIPVTFLSSQVITLTFGEGYTDAGPVLAIHIWTGIFVYLGLARGPWVLTENLVKFSFITTAIGAIINIILNYFLITKYGVIGAAVSTIVAQFVASYVTNALHPKARIIFISQTKAILMISLFRKREFT